MIHKIVLLLEEWNIFVSYFIWENKHWDTVKPMHRYLHFPCEPLLAYWALSGITAFTFFFLILIFYCYSITVSLLTAVKYLNLPWNTKDPFTGKENRKSLWLHLQCP